jgi:hypothetical protein
MNITKKYLLCQIRKMCLQCQGALKLCTEHCFEKTCPLFEIRNNMIEKSEQLSIFTKEGFFVEVERIIKTESHRFLREMYFSDIRKTVEETFKENMNKLPEDNQLNWWGSVPMILFRNGWIKNHSRKRRSPMRGDDYLYIRGI